MLVQSMLHRERFPAALQGARPLPPPIAGDVMGWPAVAEWLAAAQAEAEELEELEVRF